MNEKSANVIGVIICIVLFLFAGTLGAAIGFSTELGNVRHELDTVRAELSAASDRQSELARIAERTGTILNQSAVTISDIRKQIAEIRKSYEELENCLYSGSGSSSRTHNHTFDTTDNTE